MPRKNQFRRVRRLRLLGRAGVIAIGLGGGMAFYAVREAVHNRWGGMQGVAIGLALVAIGLSLGAWVILASRRAAVHDQWDLTSRGLDDDLPMGAFMQDQSIGLEAADLWLVWGTLAMGIGLMFAVAGATDPQVGWKFGLAFSSVGFVPAVLCFRFGTGTKYWLTSDGVETSHWPRRSVRWVEVERIVPLRRGSPASRSETFDAIELQTAKQVHAAPRWWPGSDLSIKTPLVEVSRQDLLAMIQKLVPARSLD